MTFGANLETFFNGAISQLGSDVTHKRWNAAGTLASTVGTKTVIIGMMSKEDQTGIIGEDIPQASAKIYVKADDAVLIKDILDADSKTRYILLQESAKHWLDGNETCKVFFAKKEYNP